jgi:hypothetical protein
MIYPLPHFENLCASLAHSHQTTKQGLKIDLLGQSGFAYLKTFLDKILQTKDLSEGMGEHA